MTKTIEFIAPAPYCIGENETHYKAKAVIEYRNGRDYDEKLRYAKLRFAIDNNVDFDNVKVVVIANG